ncbi:MAG: hypothetical protein ACJ8AW_50030 [Rhodopila sp.]
MSGLFSLFTRQTTPAAAGASAPAAPPIGIDHLRTRAGLGLPEVAEPEAPPAPADSLPPDSASTDAQRPDLSSPDPHPADPASPEIQPAGLALPEAQPADLASLQVQATDAPPDQQLTVEMFIEQAEQAGEAENWPAAEMIWRAIRTVIPQYWPSYAGGAAALRSLGRLDEARQLLDQGMALFPDERAFPLELGRLAMTQSDWPAAEACWRKALTFDVRPWWVYTELAGALEHQGRLEDAEAVLQEARVRADEPDALTLFIYPAQLAEKRSDWATAVARWAEARRRFPSSIEFPDRHHEALMRLTEHDPAAFHAALHDPATTSPADNRALVLRFESLGGTGPDGGCEFGCFQRAHDAEPLGLFRWAAVPPASLIAALQNRFAGIGEDGNITVSSHDGQWRSAIRSTAR